MTKPRGRWPLPPVLLAATLLVGCAPSESPDPVSEYVEPGWMAQARQEVEVYQTAMTSCYAEFGVTGYPAPGSEVLVLTRRDENGNLPPGVEELVDTAIEECGARVPLPSLWTAPTDADAYQRMLDSRACLVAQGYEISEPPSMETWLESGYEAWNPYQDLTGPDATARPKGEVLEQLMQTCPQAFQGGVAIAEVGGDDE